jgi:UDP-N-acetylglucosamine transferase subunit ALG13
VVFVTVGNAPQPFDRLIRAVDRAARGGAFPEGVFLQIGTSAYEPQHGEWSRFVTASEFDRRLAEATVLITHGGLTQLRAIRAGKFPVVMARRLRFGEHINEHQTELTTLLERQGFIAAVNEEDELAAAIQRARRMPPRPCPQSNALSIIDSSLNQLLVRAAR